jgi:DNA-binding transcriptional ArsR family regulator
VKRRPPPQPPRPDVERKPIGAFGWLQAELLHDGWLAEVGPNATAVIVLLALAADQRGASFFSRSRMATALGMSMQEVDSALQRLRDAGLVDLRPWRPGGRDGVWQLLPPPPRRQPQRDQQALSAADVLRNLGFRPM